MSEARVANAVLRIVSEREAPIYDTVDPVHLNGALSTTMIVRRNAGGHQLSKHIARSPCTFLSSLRVVQMCDTVSGLLHEPLPDIHYSIEKFTK